MPLTVIYKRGVEIVDDESWRQIATKRDNQLTAEKHARKGSPQRLRNDAFTDGSYCNNKKSPGDTARTRDFQGEYRRVPHGHGQRGHPQGKRSPRW